MGMMGMFGMMGMPQIDPKTRAFSYKTSGMAYLSGCDLTITEADGKLTASLRQTGVKPENAKTFEVDDAFFDRVTALIDKYDGDSWDGFHRLVLLLVSKREGAHHQRFRLCSSPGRHPRRNG